MVGTSQILYIEFAQTLDGTCDEVIDLLARFTHQESRIAIKVFR